MGGNVNEELDRIVDKLQQAIDNQVTGKLCVLLKEMELCGLNRGMMDQL